MTIESNFDSIDDLNASYPEANSLVSEGDDHIRGIKNALKTMFGSLGATPLSVTAEHINASVSTLLDSIVQGSITFADENHEILWDLSASTPAVATPVGYSAFTDADPYVAGSPTIAGLSLNAPIVRVNSPVLPGVTSGYQVYYRSDDAAAVCGFEFIDEVDDAKGGGISVANTGGNTDLVFYAPQGRIYLKDTEANSGAPLSLNDIWSAIEDLDTRVTALEP